MDVKPGSRQPLCFHEGRQATKEAAHVRKNWNSGSEMTICIKALWLKLTSFSSQFELDLLLFCSLKALFG